MTLETQQIAKRRATKTRKRRITWIGVVVLVVVGIALGTKVVPHDDPALEGEAAFDPETFGQENFGAVRDAVLDQAVDAEELSAAIEADPDAAAEEYAEDASGGAIYSVTVTGVVGEGASGIYELDVDGVPDDLLIRVQTGPAINGTELRDATGTMSFGDFANQIQFQDAATALNNQMKDEVLTDVDTDDLEGKTITTTGVFTLINPEAWLITPVALEVQ